VLLNS